MKSESYLEIKLVCVRAGEDPFQAYPDLKHIWPEPYKSDAAYASRVDSGTGEIFYITLGYEVVGITGMFLDDTNSTDVFLRWTGVVPGLRKAGVGREGIRQLMALCKLRYPERQRIIELVPDNEYGHTVAKPFFEKIGYVPVTVGVPEGEGTDWPVIAYMATLEA